MRSYPAAEYSLAGPGSEMASARHAVSESGPAAIAIDSAEGEARWFRPARTAQLLRAPPQRGDVTAAEPPARTGEHPHRGSAGRRVGDQPQHGHQVGDFGDGQQTGEADHFHRDSAGAQRIGDGCGIGVAAHQHRRGGRGNVVVAGRLVALLHLVGDPVAFGLDVGEQRAAHRAGRGIRA